MQSCVQIEFPLHGLDSCLCPKASGILTLNLEGISWHASCSDHMHILVPCQCEYVYLITTYLKFVFLPLLVLLSCIFVSSFPFKDKVSIFLFVRIDPNQPTLHYSVVHFSAMSMTWRAFLLNLYYSNTQNLKKEEKTGGKVTHTQFWFKKKV